MFQLIRDEASELRVWNDEQVVQCQVILQVTRALQEHLPQVDTPPTQHASGGHESSTLSTSGIAERPDSESVSVEERDETEQFLSNLVPFRQGLEASLDKYQRENRAACLVGHTLEKHWGHTVILS